MRFGRLRLKPINNPESPDNCAESFFMSFKYNLTSEVGIGERFV